MDKYFMEWIVSGCGQWTCQHQQVL